MRQDWRITCGGEVVKSGFKSQASAKRYLSLLAKRGFTWPAIIKGKWQKIPASKFIVFSLGVGESYNPIDNTGVKFYNAHTRTVAERLRVLYTYMTKLPAWRLDQSHLYSRLAKQSASRTSKIVNKGGYATITIDSKTTRGGGYVDARRDPPSMKRPFATGSLVGWLPRVFSAWYYHYSGPRLCSELSKEEKRYARDEKKYGYSIAYDLASTYKGNAIRDLMKYLDITPDEFVELTKPMASPLAEKKQVLRTIRRLAASKGIRLFLVQTNFPC